MCSQFQYSMEINHQQGDLRDIIRPSSTGGTTPAQMTWQSPSDQMNNYPPSWMEEDYESFRGIEDSLLSELEIQIPTSDNTDYGFLINNSNGGDEGSMFSRILEISPGNKLPVNSTDSRVSSRGPEPLSAVASDDKMVAASSSRSCLLGNSVVQISSPRNLGAKRRKGQPKKVVCIPAPAPANSRSTGEAVPSDLWAWRKYGQKPIKGSPYPRGYYRCSSSKGCPARKQVERSRNDPNMLVITYSSEHNHSWPTQRNALAGSTRSQPSKNKTNKSDGPNCQSAKLEGPNLQCGQKDVSAGNNADSACPYVKKEVEDNDDHDQQKELIINDAELNQGIKQEDNHVLALHDYQIEDLFADLGEIEAEPLGFLLDQGSKELDGPFSFYDWSNPKK